MGAMKKYLPSFFTLLNLASGGVGIFWALQGFLTHASYCLWIGALLDILDGTLARLLRCCCPFGKQLDSFADLTTFGWLPASLLYSLLGQLTSSPTLPYVALFIPIFAALRLARFNLDTQQQNSFIGLPVPAQGLLVSTFPSIIENNRYPWLTAWLVQTDCLTILVLIIASLMIIRIRLMAFKFTTYAWYPNRYRYSFLLLAVGLIWLLRAEGLALTVVCYIASTFCSHFPKTQP